MIEIRLANLQEVSIIHQLAYEIWPPTYATVLSEDQIRFMLEKSYSESALSQAIQSQEHQFFILYDQGIAVGFMALKINSEVLRIDKLYLKSTNQGKGLGSKMIDFAATVALNNRLNILELNVNRGNKAYNFYLKQGFKVVKSLDTPYYQFVLNDFVMQKILIS